MAESVSEPHFGAKQQSAIELEEIPLIGTTNDVVVVKDSLRCAISKDKSAAEVAGIHSAGEAEYRLLEVGLRS